MASEDDFVLAVNARLRRGELTAKEAVRVLGDWAHRTARQNPRFADRVQSDQPRPLIFNRPADCEPKEAGP
jgi:hypothetical protein